MTFRLRIGEWAAPYRRGALGYWFLAVGRTALHRQLRFPRALTIFHQPLYHFRTISDHFPIFAIFTLNHLPFTIYHFTIYHLPFTTFHSLALNHLPLPTFHSGPETLTICHCAKHSSIFSNIFRPFHRFQVSPPTGPKPLQPFSTLTANREPLQPQTTYHWYATAIIL